MKNVKKVLVLMLSVMMLFTLVACETPEDKVAKYVEENGEEFVKGMEEGFISSSGMTCTSSIKAEGRGFIIKINVDQFDNIPAETKTIVQNTYNEMKSTFDEALEEIQDEVPEVEYFVMYICEKDGDEIAVIDTRK